MATSEKDTMKRRVVVVVRHGERLDYVMRDAGQNWVASAFRPWDPPLTTDGMEQAKSLGKALPQILEQHKLPPKVKSIYSSPFLRCRQTALGIAESITSDDDDDSNTKVKVELGLAESINENWFRSWAVEGTDGTWGYLKKTMPELDPITLHPASQMPVQPLLDWQASGDETAASHPCMDPAHTSKSTLDTPYQLNPPKFESFKMQRTRMEQTLTQLSGDHIDETIVMVSHGGPVTHLYESLTGNNWNVHGESKYCCFSIYEKVGGDGDADWKPLVVNECLYDTTTTAKSSDKNATFTWA